MGPSYRMDPKGPQSTSLVEWKSVELQKKNIALKIA